MIGYTGLVLLVIAYLALITKWDRFFIPIDIFASAVLTIHAILIKDIPFMLVNGMITIILIIKFFKKQKI